jgi:hypothetical protein
LSVHQTAHAKVGAAVILAVSALLRIFSLSFASGIRNAVVVKVISRTSAVVFVVCSSRVLASRCLNTVIPTLLYRFRVTLPDAKMPGSDKDLEFFPDQYFPTANDAKHAVALLPLLHFCRERPLERKLPDPFREMWLALLASSAAAPVSATKPSAAAPPTSAPSVSVTQASSATVSSVTADGQCSRHSVRDCTLPCASRLCRLRAQNPSFPCLRSSHPKRSVQHMSVNGTVCGQRRRISGP